MNISVNFSQSPSQGSSAIWFNNVEPNQVQNNILFECVTPIYAKRAKQTVNPTAQERPAKVEWARSTTSLTWPMFARTWNTLQPDQRQHSRILRAYWLGEAWPHRHCTDELVSSFLVQSLAERVKRYKANVSMNHLIPFATDIAQKESFKYDFGESYRDWLFANKQNSKYDLVVIKALAEGKKQKPIIDFAFGEETDVLTEEEIEQVVEELKANPEPKLEIRPSDWRQANKTTEALVQAVSKLTEQQLTKG